MTDLPLAALPFLGFAHLLRSRDFPIAPEQIIAFLSSIALLGPRSMEDIKRAGRATLAPPPNRAEEFDTLFHVWFWGGTLETADSAAKEAPHQKNESFANGATIASEPQTGGQFASNLERLGWRNFSINTFSMPQFAQELRTALPTRLSFRSRRTRTNGRFDLRRSLQAIVRADGDIPRPALRSRLSIQRKLMLLIDISGSMKLHTSEHLKLAHAVAQNAQAPEIFTLGTRLTRITAALRARDKTMALSRVAQEVPDWDGGTRIGPSIQALLAIPRFAAFARGACVVLFSDGLERGEPADFVRAMKRLSLRAHRLSMCTPLAGDRRFSPQSAALAAVLPFLDDLVDGSSAAAVANFVLSLARPAPLAKIVWRKAS